MRNKLLPLLCVLLLISHVTAMGEEPRQIVPMCRVDEDCPSPIWMDRCKSVLFVYRCEGTCLSYVYVFKEPPAQVEEEALRLVENYLREQYGDFFDEHFALLRIERDPENITREDINLSGVMQKAGLPLPMEEGYFELWFAYEIYWIAEGEKVSIPFGVEIDVACSFQEGIISWNLKSPHPLYRLRETGEIISRREALEIASEYGNFSITDFWHHHERDLAFPIWIATRSLTPEEEKECKDYLVMIGIDAFTGDVVPAYKVFYNPCEVGEGGIIPVLGGIGMPSIPIFNWALLLGVCAIICLVLWLYKRRTD